MNKKVAIHTLGCKANQLESSIICQDFSNNSCQIVKFNEFSDIYIINSCTVTAKADNETRYLVRKARKANNEAIIIVTGCYAQISSEELEQLESPDFIIGNKKKLSIFDILAEYNFSKQNKTVIISSDIMNENEFDYKTLNESSKTRAHLKVQDGCDNRCSYCIIPFARGKSRSNSLTNILDQVNNLVAYGFKEIIITGIHLGQWGLDFSPKQNFIEILKELENIEGLERYRISSLNPLEFNDELINLISTSTKFCRHLHISMQNTDNDTLKLMNRHYTYEKMAELCEKLTSKMPDIAIGGDIIVGFPQETDERFENSYNNLNKLPISYLHVFPYSVRKGTVAESLDGHINETIKKQRAERLTNLANTKKTEFLEKFINSKIKVLVEKVRDKKSGKLKGLSSNYMEILFDGNDELKNTIQLLKIMKIENNVIFGKLI